MRDVQRQALTADRQLVAIIFLLALLVLVSLIEYGPIPDVIVELS